MRINIIQRLSPFRVVKSRPVLCFLLYAALAEAGALVYLLAVPTDSHNQIFGGYSLARLIAAGSFFFTLVLTITLLAQAWRRKTWEEKAAVMFFSSAATAVAILGAIGSAILLFLSFLTTQRITPVFSNRFLMERLQPLLVLALLIFVGLLPIQLGLYHRRPWISLFQWLKRLFSLIPLAENFITLASDFVTPFLTAVLTAVALLPLLFYIPLRSSFPTGSAGLYSLMAELIKQNRFALPLEVPYYGPGGIPFAYPPLGFYLMAAVEKVFGLNAFTYARFAPPLFMALAIIPLVLIAYEFTGSRAGAFFSGLVVGTSETIFNLHVTSGGIVRGLALLLVLCSIQLFLYAERKSSQRVAALAGVFAGLTALTHLSYALFALLFFAAYLLSHFSSKRVWLQLLFTGAAGALVVFPWFLFIYSRYGMAVFTGAFQSHESGYFLLLLKDHRLIMPWFENTLRPVLRAPLLWGLMILGLIDVILQRKFLLAVWFFAVLFFASESSRYIVVVGALLAAMALVRLYRSYNTSRTDYSPSQAAAPVFQGVLLIFVINIIFYSSSWVAFPEKFQPIPGKDMMELATFVHLTLPADAVYLAAIPDGDAEWLPYLLRRTPAMGTWGAEWLGTYSENLGLVFDMNGCVADDSYECVNQLLLRLRHQPEYLLTFTGSTQINQSLQAGLSWRKEYQNQAFILWETASQ